jgi:hypothetical protein
MQVVQDRKAERGNASYQKDHYRVEQIKDQLPLRRLVGMNGW